MPTDAPGIAGFLMLLSALAMCLPLRPDAFTRPICVSVAQEKGFAAPPRWSGCRSSRGTYLGFKVPQQA
jgi:hypothetical protein